MNLTEIERDFVSVLQKAGMAEGMDPFITKLFAISYISPKDLSLDEIAEKTGYSLASISNKMKILRNIGLIKKIRKPGSKKIYVKVEKNILKMHRDMMILKESTSLKHAKELLPSIIMKYKDKKLSKTDKEKLKNIEKYNKQILISDELIKKIIVLFNKALKKYEK